VQDSQFSSFKVFRTQYRQAITELLQTILDEVVFVGHEWSLPGNLGSMRIRKHKPKLKIGSDGQVITIGMAVDYGATKQLWASNPKAANKRVLIYHTNNHTHGYRMCFWWDKRISRIRNQSAYWFRASRTNKRTLAAMIKFNDGTIDFFN